MSAGLVLLVEDNPSDVELTLHVLARYAVSDHIHVVRDGAEALDFMFRTGAYADRHSSGPKVVLLDLKLPKVGGLEVLRRLKGDERARTVPVVVMTSSREERDLVESYRLGVNSYVVKPVEFAQFVDAVGHVGRYWATLNEAPLARQPGDR